MNPKRKNYLKKWKVCLMKISHLYYFFMIKAFGLKIKKLIKLTLTHSIILIFDLQILSHKINIFK